LTAPRMPDAESAVVIANPRAGVAARSALAAVQAAQGRWGSLPIRITAHRGHARELAAEAVREGRGLVLACGGDGTVNEVAWGLLGSGAVLGVLPAGSGNGFARTLGIPRSPRRALAMLGGCVPAAIDVGMANGRPFLNVAGVGFDAALGQAFEEHCRRGGRRGVLSYFRIGLKIMWGHRSQEVEVEVDGSRWRRRVLLVTFANGRQYGGGAVIAPRARIDDGLLDVVSVREAGPVEMIGAVARMYTGRIERFRCYEKVRARAAVLAADTPIAFHRDGEPDPPVERVEITTLPGALRVLVPRSRLSEKDGPFGGGA
jgi:diacylglycerol kinase (ATP)